MVNGYTKSCCCYCYFVLVIMVLRAVVVIVTLFHKMKGLIHKLSMKHVNKVASECVVLVKTDKSPVPSHNMARMDKEYPWLSYIQGQVSKLQLE